MPHTSFITDGYEQMEKTVKPFGDNSAHVGIPKGWIGCKVAITRLEEKPSGYHEICIWCKKAIEECTCEYNPNTPQR